MYEKDIDILMEDPTKVIVKVDTAEREKTGLTITYTLFVEIPDFAITNILELENIGNEWRISIRLSNFRNLLTGIKFISEEQGLRSKVIILSAL